jgi:hypothetical protein
MPQEAKELKMLATIKSFLERCALEKMNGELVLRLSYNQGGIRNMEVQRIESLSEKVMGKGQH